MGFQKYDVFHKSKWGLKNYYQPGPSIFWAALRLFFISFSTSIQSSIAFEYGPRGELSTLNSPASLYQRPVFVLRNPFITIIGLSNLKSEI